MSFLAKLIIDGEEFNVLEFDIHFSQKTDGMGKPDDITRGGSFKIVIESDRNTDFLSWMLSTNEMKDGSIVFYRRDAMSKLKELKFSKAFCIDYKESFKSTTEVPMKIELEIMAKGFDFSGTIYERPWTIEV